MPTLLEADPGTDAGPFSDLIGGENGAPAYQVVAGRFSEVPKAEPVTPLDLGAFADMVPGPGKDVEMPAVEQDLGIFQALVPQSPTAESEKALAETPKPPDPAWIGFEKGIENVTGQPFHQVGNAIRVFGQTAGRYIFDGMEAFERNRAQYYENPTPEAYQAQGDQILLPDGSRMSPDEEAALEQRYKDELAKHAPAALENAATIRKVWDKTEASIPTDPALADTVPARLAAAAGPVAVMTAESLIPEAGLPWMVMHGALATEQEALDAGATPEQAQRAAIRSAIGLGIFGGASKIAAASVAKALPWLVKDPSQLTRFVAQFTGQEAANETSSRVIQAWNAAADAPEGQKLQAATAAATETNLENTVMNTMYALAHAAKASRGAAKPPMSPETAAVLKDLSQQIRDNPNQTEFVVSLRPEAPISPASEPGIAPAPESGRVPETPQGAKPAREPTPANERPAAMQPVATEPEGTVAMMKDAIAQYGAKRVQEAIREEGYVGDGSMDDAGTVENALIKLLNTTPPKGGGEPDAVQIRSAETQIPRAPETGQNQPGDRERVRPSQQGQEAARTPGQEEVQAVISPERDLISKLTGQEPKRPLEQIESEIGRLSRQTATDPSMSDEAFHSAAMRIKELEAERARDYPERQAEIEKFQNQPQNWAASVTPVAKIGAVETLKAKARDASAMIQDVVNESRKMGLVAPGATGVQGGIQHLGKIWRQIRDLPKFGDFKKAILGFGQKMQSSFLEAKEIQRTLKKQVPSRVAREGIFNFIEAGGDKATLTTWRDASPEPALKRGYQAALDLTPEHQAIATHLADFYANKLAEGQAAGILAEGRENYVNRIVDKRRSLGFAPVTAGGSGVGTSGRLSKNFKHGLHRVYENSFDAERNGIRYKTKDIAELAPIYLTEMNKTIGTRQLLADLAHGTAEDGRALAFPKGSMSTVTGKEGETKASLIKPNTKQMVLDEITGKDVSAADYRSVEHPALNGWKWVGADAEGKPILIQGDLALHPEIANHVKNLLGESALRRWYNSDGSPLASIPKGLIRGIDKAQQAAKELLFSGSGFHHANIGFHAVEHRVNPLPEFFKSLSRDYTIDPQDPKVQDWMQHSLQLAPDQLSARHFMEGFSGRAVQKVPLYGKVATAISDHLFERFIPALKLRLANAMLDRNVHLYAGDIAANKVTPDQVKYLSAQQANSALSHINYIDIGRNPTMQHLLSLSTLAPDFSESRARFLSQAGKTLLGSKAGVEQFTALAYGAGLIWSMARVLNKIVDDDYHFEEPFGVVHNGRRYSIRSIQGDVAHMLTEPQKFIYGRVSPLVKLGLEQFITGTNYRGEKIGHLESLKEYFANYVPISLKNVPGLKDLFETTKNNPVTPWESFMGAMGVQASRYSPISKTYKAARDWKKAAGLPEDKGSYPVSKYQQLRYSLEDGDFDRARTEYQKLVESGEKPAKVSDGFRRSMLHPFTGSAANDLQFKKTLTGDDRLMYEAAIKKRHEILRRYQFMLQRR